MPDTLFSEGIFKVYGSEKIIYLREISEPVFLSFPFLTYSKKANILYLTVVTIFFEVGKFSRINALRFFPTFSSKTNLLELCMMTCIG